MINIPLLKPSCSEKEIQYVTDVLRSGWWGLGAKVEEFEEKFASFIGVKYAVAVNSATTALDLALRVHNVSGQEIIVPALTFVSTALVGLYSNCKIVFADIDEETLCMDWDDAMSKVTSKTGAIILVHYGGRTSQFTTNFSFPVIQDCAHAVGNHEVGTQGTSCWSFHAVKNLAMGDGGMITTNDEHIAERLRALRWCGIDKSTWDRSQKKYGWDYSIEEVGYKAHMNDIAAAIGLAQLERIEDLNNKRKLRVLQYLYELSHLKWLTLPAYDANSSWHLFVVRMKQRNKFIDYLLAHGISAGVHYKPLNTYPIFPQTVLPVTDRVWQELVTLPLFPDMTDEEFQYIINTIKQWKHE